MILIAGVSKPGQPRRTQDQNRKSFPLGVRGFKSHLLHLYLKINIEKFVFYATKILTFDIECLEISLCIFA